ncbi:MAG: hypothetical protein ACI910_002196 [Oleispira sp.]|jgi:hypothetical protein
MQLIFTFIILSVVTLIAMLLILLNKNTRSAKIRQIAQENNWQYQEFVNFNDDIKYADFGLLNYSQNVIFRHFIQADNEYAGLAFNTFDCRAIEPLGIHNSSIILFTLTLGNEFKNLHLSINRFYSNKDAFNDLSHQQSMKNQYRLQKLTALEDHKRPKVLRNDVGSASKIDVYTNDANQAYRFIQHVCSTAEDEKSVIHWLLAHPNLHIEISDGMLMAYQKNTLIEDTSLIAAIDSVAQLALLLSRE